MANLEVYIPNKSVNPTIDANSNPYPFNAGVLVEIRRVAGNSLVAKYFDPNGIRKEDPSEEIINGVRVLRANNHPYKYSLPEGEYKVIIKALQRHRLETSAILFRGDVQDSGRHGEEPANYMMHVQLKGWEEIEFNFNVAAYSNPDFVNYYKINCLNTFYNVGTARLDPRSPQPPPNMGGLTEQQYYAEPIVQLSYTEDVITGINPQVSANPVTGSFTCSYFSSTISYTKRRATLPNTPTIEVFNQGIGNLSTYITNPFYQAPTNNKSIYDANVTLSGVTDVQTAVFDDNGSELVGWTDGTVVLVPDSAPNTAYSVVRDKNDTSILSNRIYKSNWA